jgi:hypothetical protein
VNQRYYEITSGEAAPRIVEAQSASAAIRHASRGVYKAKVLNARELAAHVKAGVLIEVAPKLEVAGEAK